MYVCIFHLHSCHEMLFSELRRSLIEGMLKERWCYKYLPNHNWISCGFIVDLYYLHDFVYICPFYEPLWLWRSCVHLASRGRLKFKSQCGERYLTAILPFLSRSSVNLGMNYLMDFLTCLCPEDFFHHFRALSTDHFVVVSVTFLFVPSLPSIPLSTDTQTTVTLLCFSSSFSAQTQLHISRKVILVV